MGCKNSKNKMKIVIKTITDEAITLKVDGSNTVLSVKAMIHANKAGCVNGMLPGNQRLVFAGKTLEDGRTLASYNIREKSFVHVVTAGADGARRWRRLAQAVVGVSIHGGFVGGGPRAREEASRSKRTGAEQNAPQVPLIDDIMDATSPLHSQFRSPPYFDNLVVYDNHHQTIEMC